MDQQMTRRIGDAARSAGVGVETVRFYEREGLIEQPLKPLRGWREYDEAAMLQLGYVRQARALGLTLKNMREIKGLSSGTQPPFCQGVRATVSSRLAEIDKEIATLSRKRTALRRWLAQCKRREPGSCPLYAQLRSIAPAAVPTRKDKRK